MLTAQRWKTEHMHSNKDSYHTTDYRQARNRKPQRDRRHRREVGTEVWAHSWSNDSKRMWYQRMLGIMQSIVANVFKLTAFWCPGWEISTVLNSCAKAGRLSYSTLRTQAMSLIQCTRYVRNLRELDTSKLWSRWFLKGFYRGFFPTPYIRNLPSAEFMGFLDATLHLPSTEMSFMSNFLANWG